MAEHDIDRTDARLLLGLVGEPRAAAMTLAERLGLSRNTVQARLSRLESTDALQSFEHRVNPDALGYPLRAFVTLTVQQQGLDAVGMALAEIPEVLEVFGLSGASDLLAQVVARDANDLYRIAGQILATPNVIRTETALVMRQLVKYRVSPLLETIAGVEPPTVRS